MLVIMVMCVIVFVVVMVLMPVDVATLNRERMSRFLHYIMSLKYLLSVTVLMFVLVIMATLLLVIMFMEHCKGRKSASENSSLQKYHLHSR